ncbi:MAG: WcbI family polysaccharide biosynthesis putative acetyltransferase [Desulfobulbaceae bacterium]|nr:WcbI family polysaccharide biosynthesis putative acetyltransferase [Desulfobulbaceae bacterium]HIJ91448.1 hypothetical protein [Deltaproteobacteria bacterium]
MKKQLCIIFSNGQGLGVQHFLNKSPHFANYYDIIFLCNYKSEWQEKKIPSELLKNASVVIYQDLLNNDRHLKFKDIGKFIHSSSRLISFPNIYFSGLWPFFEEGANILSGEEILDDINKGEGFKSLIRKFCSLSLELDFDKRFSNSKQQLIHNESNTDIKISDFILEHIHKEKLFLTQNHPTSIVFAYLVNQILSLLNFPRISCDCTNTNEANLPGYWPISPYDSNYYNFSYQKIPDENWKFFYSFLIAKIYYGMGITNRPLQRFFVKEYTKFLTYT